MICLELICSRFTSLFKEGTEILNFRIANKTRSGLSPLPLPFFNVF